VQRDAVPAERDPDYNVAPTKRIYAVLEHQDEPAARPIGSEGSGAQSGGTGGRPPGRRQLRLLRWGLVPSWAKDTSGGARLINARSETVAVKPSFRAAFAKRRCLIPADGYYEWMTSGKIKQPYYIYRTDGGILPFAGLYELWRNAELPEDHEDAWYWSATIITTQAADEIGRIHDRTPMIIAPENWADWLDPANKEREPLLAAMLPATSAGSGGLTSHQVGTSVNSVRNNGPALIEPLRDADPPGLF
jgi:putative SOS response-associated peptidase YedK